jgi:hypothetical protein
VISVVASDGDDVIVSGPPRHVRRGVSASSDEKVLASGLRSAPANWPRDLVHEPRFPRLSAVALVGYELKALATHRGANAPARLLRSLATRKNGWMGCYRER